MKAGLCNSAALWLVRYSHESIDVPTAESHFDGLRNALDDVAREEQYLAFLQAPPPEQAFAFFQNIATNDLCQFVAIQDGVIVGWCDVLPTHGEARAHVGILGIGLVSHARHIGIGAKLIEAAISKAWGKGVSRIELTVRIPSTTMVSVAHPQRFFISIKMAKLRGHMRITSNPQAELRKIAHTMKIVWRA